ncbi:MAG: class I SAM-dependent methyltransferase [Alphaproteobacteria bacterium]
MPAATPSDWVRRFAPLIRDGGHVLDLAAGTGRHTRLLVDMGLRVTAIDRDIETLRGFAGSRCDVRQIDLETGDPAGDPNSVVARLGDGYDGIVVTNYLHRPLLRPLAAMLAPGGVLIYETFMTGNEHFGRPRNPEFLLRPGELPEAFAGLTTVAFEQGEVSRPRPAAIQRIAAIAAPVGLLPEPPFPQRGPAPE